MLTLDAQSLFNLLSLMQPVTTIQSAASATSTSGDASAAASAASVPPVAIAPTFDLPEEQKQRLAEALKAFFIMPPKIAKMKPLAQMQWMDQRIHELESYFVGVKECIGSLPRLERGAAYHRFLSLKNIIKEQLTGQEAIRQGLNWRDVLLQSPGIPIFGKGRGTSSLSPPREPLSDALTPANLHFFRDPLRDESQRAYAASFRGSSFVTNRASILQTQLQKPGLVLDSTFSANTYDQKTGACTGFTLAAADGCDGHKDPQEDRNIRQASHFATKQAARLLGSYPDAESILSSMDAIIESIKEEIRLKASQIGTTSTTTLLAVRAFVEGDHLRVVGFNVGDGMLFGLDPMQNQVYPLAFAHQMKSMDHEGHVQFETAMLPTPCKPQEIHRIDTVVPLSTIIFGMTDGIPEALRPMVCDFISMSVAPDISTLDALPITANAAYVKVQDQLFYINKRTRECVPLQISPEVLSQLTAEIIKELPLNESKRLTHEELEMIERILGLKKEVHYHNPETGKEFVYEETSLRPEILKTLFQSDPPVMIASELTELLLKHCIRRTDVLRQEKLGLAEQERGEWQIGDDVAIVGMQLSSYARNPAQLPCNLCSFFRKTASIQTPLKQTEHPNEMKKHDKNGCRIQ